MSFLPFLLEHPAVQDPGRFLWVSDGNVTRHPGSGSPPPPPPPPNPR